MMDTELIDQLQRSGRVHRKVSKEVGRPANHSIRHVSVQTALESCPNFNCICSLYRTIQKVIVKNVRVQEAVAKLLAKYQQAYIIYENFNCQRTCYSQIISDINEQVNITTSFIAINRHIPKTSLIQDILDQNKELNLIEIIRAITDNTYSNETALYYIDKVIGYIFGSTINLVFTSKAKAKDCS